MARGSALTRAGASGRAAGIDTTLMIEMIDWVDPLDVLVVGAGPTGLTLAAQLNAFGTRFRIVDRLLDRAHELRALAVQARTLEILANLGLAEQLVSRGRTTTRFMVHFEDRVAHAQLGGFGASHTRFPFILFVSQAETEALLGGHLASHDVKIERGIALARFDAKDAYVHCVLRHSDGSEEEVLSRYLVGCDGAHSTVRHRAGIPFQGGDYLEDFALGDVEVDGQIERDALHAYAGKHGFAMFFPLGVPTTWRIIAMPTTGTSAATDTPITGALSLGELQEILSLGELQEIVDGATSSTLRLRDPAWLTHFRLHHRQTAHYRSGRVFLAGDAAHIHSPVGAQGMNTGIQDAWNLGWKLAMVAHGHADPRLLDSYEAERWPVGHLLLRTTDRVFALFSRVMSAGALAAWLRREVASRILPAILSSSRLRARAFRFVSELDIRYRRSPAVTEGSPRLRAGPRAGDRLPDAGILCDGQPTFLQNELSGPHLHLLLCGPPHSWDQTRIALLSARYGGLLAIHTLSCVEQTGALVDVTGDVMARFGVRDAAQYLVRPDGHIGFRCAGSDLDALTKYLARWLSVAAPPTATC